MSLRRRSTIIRFSARFFASARQRRRAARASRSGSGSRGAVPFIGRVSIPPAPSSAKKSSGDRDTQRRPGSATSAPCPTGCARGQPACERRRVAATSARRSETSGSPGRCPRRGCSPPPARRPRGSSSGSQAGRNGPSAAARRRGRTGAGPARRRPRTRAAAAGAPLGISGQQPRLEGVAELVAGIARDPGPAAERAGRARPAPPAPRRARRATIIAAGRAKRAGRPSGPRSTSMKGSHALCSGARARQLAPAARAVKTGRSTRRASARCSAPVISWYMCSFQ